MQVSRYRYAVSLALLALIGSVFAAAPSAAAGDCPSGQTQFKIDSRPSNGTYGDGTLSVTISNADENSFSWSSNITVESVMVKAGTTLKSNPGGRSGTASSAENPNNGKPYGISHVSFCYESDDEGGDDNQQSREDDDCADRNGGKECDEDDDCESRSSGKADKECDEVESDDEKNDEVCVEGKGKGNGNGNGNMGKDCDDDNDKDDDDDTLADVDTRPSQPDGVSSGSGGDGAEPGSNSGNDGPNTGPAADVRGLRINADVGATRGAAQVGATQQAPGRTLPFTGFALLPFLLAGVGLVGAGVLLRRRRTQ